MKSDIFSWPEPASFGTEAGGAVGPAMTTVTVDSSLQYIVEGTP
ncbi:MAG TPA: hypothetical protein VMD92_01430 [Acidobacteriaceae bacterium]|nr:hypothetical protein [Acidobacteriaceae bacterium]